MAGASRRRRKPCAPSTQSPDCNALPNGSWTSCTGPVLDRLAGYAEGTAERREALATLALIRRVMAVRQAHAPKPGF